MTTRDGDFMCRRTRHLILRPENWLPPLGIPVRTWLSYLYVYSTPGRNTVDIQLHLFVFGCSKKLLSISAFEIVELLLNLLQFLIHNKLLTCFCERGHERYNKKSKKTDYTSSQTIINRIVWFPCILCNFSLFTPMYFYKKKSKKLT